MSAIADYVVEIQRQADLLSAATERDGLALSLLTDGRRPAVFVNHTRRVWTRMDRRRLDDEIEAERLWHIHHYQGGDLQTPPPGNWYTRHQVILRRLRSTVEMAQHAMDEARTEGTFPVVAPLIAAAAEAHNRLVEMHRQEEYATEICRHFEEAVERLRIYSQFATPLTPTQARNKFCYEQWQAGKTYKEIFVAVRRRQEWEHFGAPLAVRSAIKSWAGAHYLPIRRGQRGKRPQR